MREAKLTADNLKHIELLVAHFIANHHQFERIAAELNAAFTTSPALKPLVHSLKWRIKDPDHLREKLSRKWLKAKKEGRTFRVTRENLFRQVNDLVGFRVLHLHMKQMERLNEA